MGLVFENYFAIHGSIRFSTIDEVYKEVGSKLTKRYEAINNPDMTLPFEKELHGDSLRLFNLASTKVDSIGRQETKQSVVAAQKIFKNAKSRWEARKRQLSVEGLINVPKSPSLSDYLKNYLSGLKR